MIDILLIYDKIYNMKYYSVKELDKYGFVKAFAVPKDIARWRIYSHDIKSGMEDLKYYNDLANDFGITPNDMIRIPQSHTSNVYIAKHSDGGQGVVRMELDGGWDGIVTNEKNLMLLTIESDCTPVYILDPVKKAIGMVHSGWRGTVDRITEKAILLMEKEYGSRAEDLIVHFGPAICANCYEVGMELIDEFKKILKCDDIHKVFKPIVDKEEKFFLDVTEAIRLSLIDFGIKEENMTRDRICTFHDDIFNSWRRDKDKTKQMLTGIIMAS